MEAETNYQEFITNTDFVDMVMKHNQCDEISAIKYLSKTFMKVEKLDGKDCCPESDTKLDIEMIEANPEPIKIAKPDELNTSQTPCGECGGTIFLRTGTCHVCQTCGASQGCS